MIPDHTCHWTRHHRSHLTRKDGGLGGAGIPMAVLEHAASAIGVTVSRSRSREDEFTEDVSIGDVSGTVHDGCFISFDRTTARFEAALFSGIAALHATYLGADALLPDVMAPVHDLLREGWSIELEAKPRHGTLKFRAYPHDAGWWARKTAPTLTLQARP